MLHGTKGGELYGRVKRFINVGKIFAEIIFHKPKQFAGAGKPWVCMGL